jgi:hypothetical protein
MNRKLLDSQIGTRLAEAYIVNYSHDRVCNEDQLPAAPDTSKTCGRGTQSSTGTLAITRPRGNRLVSDFVWTSARVGCPPFPRMAIACLEKTHRGYFSDADPNEVRTLNLVLFTEYKRNGQLFHAHPAYRGGLPWHDWAMFRYAKSAQDVARGKSYMEVTHDDEVYHGDPPDIAQKHHYTPGKILCFVEEDKKPLMAVVLWLLRLQTCLVGRFCHTLEG